MLHKHSRPRQEASQVSSDWPQVPGRNFSLSTMYIDPPQRKISHRNVLALMNVVIASAMHHVNKYGNTLVPPDPPLIFANRGIRFRITAYRGVAETGLIMGYEDDIRLRWADIIPIIVTFRAKMIQDTKLFGPEAWREMAARIVMHGSAIRLGDAKIVDYVASPVGPHNDTPFGSGT
ncbi:MAG: hypothetical protein Q9223_005165 [Gallowayella weberi]